ncbi:MAG: MBL fold metallo-hydrolase [Rickettsiales bacterium]|nr:MBL fold metallo-hydrolase [Pseudomonadota bacterium]MDA0966569.1 MBL fold metallo-hydrolase [Pseudomonadota bacterium]MDG4543598.1 MBL fold metallo-hydrolase [Rickettsiales bacterium]MDG4545745.1 MBL fold metallo-hydrolase [Rickettsiales bacterium]MDG4547482.1 MBL fold metallo-hydrolase [Rickettsiales bacterium]
MTGNFTVKFWGVRGTVPVPGKNTIKYGGNTSCVELMCNKRQIIFDAGTGIVPLGNQTDNYHTDILMSHTHLDHISGFPFFKPLHTPDSMVSIWAGHLKPENTVKKAMGHLMMSPVFPLALQDVQSRVLFNDFMAGEMLLNKGFQKDGITIDTLPLNHPDRATAYRVEFNNKSVCYVTDVEHEIDSIDHSLVKFIEDADVFIYDSTYDDNNFDKYKGWGHSTWQQGARLADAAHVKNFIAFHHDPNATDEDLDKRAEELKGYRKNGKSTMAAEGLTLEL